MKMICLIGWLFFSATANSQQFFTTVFAGAANYSGDISDKALTLVRAKPAWGVGLMYELTPHFLIRADFHSGRLYANDKYSGSNTARNLSFNSDIAEFSIGAEYVLLNLYQYKVSPYAFAGAGVFKFSPYIKAQNGSRIILSEFDTEGQGFYMGRTKYKLRQLCIPFGAGLQWAIKDNFRVALTLGIRKTFTDYLDDVSTTYVDKNLLQEKRGVRAVQLAYRGGELPNGDPYPPEGAIRGNPDNKDWYYFSGVSLRFRLGYKRSREVKPIKLRRGPIPCPKLF
jgi:hypothetical protein